MGTSTQGRSERLCTNNVKMQQRKPMRINTWLVVAGAAAGLCLGVSQSLAQQDTQGTQGGGRPNFRNMDPAQRQQYFMDQMKERFEVTDDAEWKALQPMVQKVMDLSRQVAGDRMRAFFRPRTSDQGGDQSGRRGGMFGQQQPSPEAEALQRAIDGKASNSELKAAVAKYSEWRKAKQAELEKAQAELRKVLSVRQEAIATSSGLL
jgi:hypothetical protein